jgi:hypothetical protein
MVGARRQRVLFLQKLLCNFCHPRAGGDRVHEISSRNECNEGMEGFKDPIPAPFSCARCARARGDNDNVSLIVNLRGKGKKKDDSPHIIPLEFP